MAYCPNCTAEYRPHVSACPACGSGLVDDAVHEPEGPPPEGDLCPVYQASAVEEIASVRAALEAHGIGSFTENEHAPYLAIGMPTSAVQVRVLVREGELESARAVVADILRSRDANRAREAPEPSQKRGSGRWRLLPVVALLLVLVSVGEHAALGRTSVQWMAFAVWSILAIAVVESIRRTSPMRETPRWRVLVYALWGVVAAPMIALRGTRAVAEALGIDGSKDIVAYVFLAVGPVEEFAKVAFPFLMVAAVAAWRRNREWLIAAAASGAGFGMSENVIVHLAWSTYGAEPAILRGGALVFHTWLSSLIGYGVARARGPASGVAAFVMWFALAAFVHGAWDAAWLSRHLEWWTVVPLLVPAAMAISAGPMLRRSAPEPRAVATSGGEGGIV